MRSSAVPVEDLLNAVADRMGATVQSNVTMAGPTVSAKTSSKPKKHERKRPVEGSGSHG